MSKLVIAVVHQDQPPEQAHVLESFRITELSYQSLSLRLVLPIPQARRQTQQESLADLHWRQVCRINRKSG